MKTWLLRLQPFFLVLAGGWLLWLLLEQWEALQNYSWQLHWYWLLTATLLMAASWALEVTIWRYWLQLLAGRLPYLAAARIWFLSAIVRYIPGNIWQPLSMTLYCQRWAIRPEVTVASVLFFQLITLLAVAPITALYLFLQPQAGRLPALLADWPMGFGALLLLPVALFLLTPQAVFRLINWGLARFGRPGLPLQANAFNLTALLLLAILHWLCWGAAFAALTFALGNFSGSALGQLAPHLIALYVVAYAVGFLSLITPSGFGVREGVLYLLLTPFLDAGLATVAVLLMRGWTTLGEFVLAGLSTLLGEQRAGLGAQPQPTTAQGLPESIGNRPT